MNKIKTTLAYFIILITTTLLIAAAVVLWPLTVAVVFIYVLSWSLEWITYGDDV